MVEAHPREPRPQNARVVVEENEFSNQVAGVDIENPGGEGVEAEQRTGGAGGGGGADGQEVGGGSGTESRVRELE